MTASPETHESNAPQQTTAVVIGGGLGGLSAAAALAAEGYRVQVFEKNDKLGGKLNVAQKEGFSFDLGPSIIILPHLFERVFTRAGKKMADYVQFQALKPHWRSFFEDGTHIDLHPDMEAMERELEKLGTGGEGYWAFMEYSRRLWKFAEEYYLERGADHIGEILKGVRYHEAIKRTDLFSRMDRGVARYVKHRNLADMLGFFIKYVGSSQYRAPAMMNLLAYSQMGYGLFYVKGGMYNLARGLSKLLADLGVEVNLNTEVVALPKSGQRIDGVTLADGTTQRAALVVSNMEVIPAYKTLLSESGPMIKTYESVFEPAASGLVVHLGVDRIYPQLQHHNFFFSRDSKKFLDTIHRKKQLPEDPNIYLVCPTKTDRDLAPEGHDIIKILPHIPYIQEPPFSAADYEALKQRVYTKLERMGLTDLRKHTVVEDVLIPDDIQRMYYSNKGAIYGVVSDMKRNFALKPPKKSRKYENLYFVGGSVNPGGGTPMVVTSGQKAVDRILADHPPF
jgi:diapolycopene oxygenase